MVQNASVEVAGLCNISRVTVEPQVGINGHAKRLELETILDPFGWRFLVGHHHLFSHMLNEEP